MSEYVIMDRCRQHSFKANTDVKAIEKAVLFAHDLGYNEGWFLFNSDGKVIYDSFSAYLEQLRK